MQCIALYYGYHSPISWSRLNTEGLCDKSHGSDVCNLYFCDLFLELDSFCYHYKKIDVEFTVDSITHIVNKLCFVRSFCTWCYSTISYQPANSCIIFPVFTTSFSQSFYEFISKEGGKNISLKITYGSDPTFDYSN